MQAFERGDVVALLRSANRAVIVIVDRDPAVANAAAHTFARNQSWVSKSVAADLAPILLETRPLDRADRAIEWLDREAIAASPSPLVLTEIDLLFEPALGIDVPRMLAGAARRTPILVAWPGDFAKGLLSYAAPGHALYQSLQWRDVSVVRAAG